MGLPAVQAPVADAALRPRINGPSRAERLATILEPLVRKLVERARRALRAGVALHDAADAAVGAVLWRLVDPRRPGIANRDPARPIVPWLYVVARNELRREISRLRRAARQNLAFEPGAVSDIAPPSRDPAQEAEVRDSLAHARAAAAEFPEPDRKRALAWLDAMGDTAGASRRARCTRRTLQRTVARLRRALGVVPDSMSHPPAHPG